MIRICLSAMVMASVLLSACGGGGGSEGDSPAPGNGGGGSGSGGSDDLVDIPLQSSVTMVQPMTGIVLWADAHESSPLKNNEGYIQLEYAYVRPSDVVIGKDQYDWTPVENLLNDVASRHHQAILRWYYVYPGFETAVPDYIKGYADYEESEGVADGEDTWFPDWSHAELKQAHLDFYTAFAEHYDEDERIAFLQVGFGLWAEYHIWEPGEQPGVNFPSKAFQKTFLNHLDNVFDELKWSISIDAADNSFSPIENNADLRALDFGNFDDSFMHEKHAAENEPNSEIFGYEQRFARAPHGGELSYYNNFDQRHALDEAGMYGRTYEQLSAKFHITYMIGNDQPKFQSNERIKAAGMANGYRFRVTSFKASGSQSQVTVANEGIAPIYYDAFLAVDGLRAEESLKGLLPGESLSVSIARGGNNPVLTIESDRLVNEQEIEFEADL